jgi:hypothetical protein
MPVHENPGETMRGSHGLFSGSMKWVFSGILAVAGFSVAQENLSLWQYRENVKLNTSVTGAAVAGDVVNFPLLVRLNAANFGTGFAQAKAGGADLRFTKGDSVTRLSHQIESWDSAGKTAAIWVRVDTVKGNATTQKIVMHWGKADAADSSKGAAVFQTSNGFQGVWHLNTSANDATGNANHGVDNLTTDTAGIIGRGRSFGGSTNDFRVEDTLTGQYIRLGKPASLNISGIITMEAWARWRVAFDGDRTILVHTADGTSENRGETFLRPASVTSGGLSGSRYEAGIHVGTTPAGGTLNNYMSGNIGNASGADFDTWIRLVGVYDGSIWTVYYNGDGSGSAVGSQSQDGRGAILTNGAWYIGGHPRPANGGNAWSRWFSGDLDEVRISNVARSADWVKLDYENQRSGSTTVQVGNVVGVRPDRALRTASDFSMRSVSGGVAFALPASSKSSRLTILDAQGRSVWSRTVSAGERSLVWSGVSAAGRVVPQGPYAVRFVDADGAESVRRFVLMR